MGFLGESAPAAKLLGGPNRGWHAVPATKHLTLGVLQNLPIPKPQFDEAMSIGEQRQVVEKKIESITRKKTLFGDLFRTLLHQLMTAQIRVYDLDLEEILAQVVRDNGNSVLPKGE